MGLLASGAVTQVTKPTAAAPKPTLQFSLKPTTPAPSLPLKTGGATTQAVPDENTTTTAGKYLNGLLAGPKERFQAVKDSVQQRSLAPLNKSLGTQLAKYGTKEGAIGFALGMVGQPEGDVGPIARNLAKETKAGVQDAAVSRPKLPTASAAEVPPTPPPSSRSSISSPPNPTPPSFKSRLLSTVSKAKTAATEYVQDTGVRVKQLVSRPDVKVTDQSDPYLKMDLYPGRVGSKIEEGKIAAESTINDAQALAKATGKSLPEIRDTVNTYLHSIHAPERNAALGDGAAGMTTKEAEANVKAIEASPEAPHIKAIADQVKELHGKTLSMLKDSGVISDDLFNTLRTKYANHVPLQRIMEDSNDVGSILSGTGAYDVRGTGLKTATGSDRQVSDILGNVVQNYQEAAIRSEKNIVDQATLKFVRDNPHLSDLFEIQKPKAIGTDFSGKPLMERMDDPSTLVLRENGKQIGIKIKDPRLAVALRGIGREQLGPFLGAVGSVTRFFASLATRFNPAFFAPNKLRDLQETMIYLASQKGIGASGAARTVAHDPSSVKSVIDAIRGKDTPGARLYAELKAQGGTTGGFGLSTREQVNLDLDKMEKLATSNPQRYAHNVIKYVDNLNAVFEDSTRLSVYKTALERGMSKERAAQQAKEASINFNKMGKGGPVINALYMFSNASIQGTAKMLRAFRNPKVAAGTIAAVGGSVAAVNAYNDRVDPQWRDKVSKWDRLNGLTVMLPPKPDGTVRYFTIPVAWGVKPIKVMADYASDALHGEKVDPKTALSTFVTSVTDAYNPVGGTDLMSSVTPTILDTPVDLARNRSWNGNKIKPDLNPNAPASIQYYSSLGQTTSGKAAIAATRVLADHGIELSPADVTYAYQQLIGGAGRTATQLSDTVTGAATGKLPPASDFPLLSRFYRETPADQVGSNAQAAAPLKDIQAQDAKDKFYQKQDVQAKWDQIKALPDATSKKAALQKLAASDPATAKAIIALAKTDAKNLTGLDSKLANASTAARAQFIHEHLATLTSNDEKKAYLKDLMSKKIVTADVLKALAALMKQ